MVKILDFITYISGCGNLCRRTFFFEGIFYFIEMNVRKGEK